MGAPKSRGLPRRRFREVMPTPPAPQQWSVHVTFDGAARLVISFVFCRMVDDVPVICQRAPIGVAAALRTQLPVAHRALRSGFKLEDSPEWGHNDATVSIGGVPAALHEKFVVQFQQLFNQTCLETDVDASMILGTPSSEA